MNSTLSLDFSGVSGRIKFNNTVTSGFLTRMISLFQVIDEIYSVLILLFIILVAVPPLVPIFRTEVSTYSCVKEVARS